MPEQVLLDNDVALKVACYSLVDEMIAVTTFDETPSAILGVGRFVIRGRLDRAANIADVPRAKAAFEQLLKAVTLLEPDDEELAMAADLEAEANRRALELDGGESQLLAILARRACRLLITGDKRAIAAMALVAPLLAANRIGCLEQLMAQLVVAAGADVVRPLVCGEPRVDRAITSCFGCSGGQVDREDILAGLLSYISHLDRSAPGVLLLGFGVTAG
jgi:hypothetical protein